MQFKNKWDGNLENNKQNSNKILFESLLQKYLKNEINLYDGSLDEKYNSLNYFVDLGFIGYIF